MTPRQFAKAGHTPRGCEPRQYRTKFKTPLAEYGLHLEIFFEAEYRELTPVAGLLVAYVPLLKGLADNIAASVSSLQE